MKVARLEKRSLDEPEEPGHEPKKPQPLIGDFERFKAALDALTVQAESQLDTADLAALRSVYGRNVPSSGLAWNFIFLEPTRTNVQAGWRDLYSSFRSLSVAELRAIWDEAAGFSLETPATESALSRIDSDVPSVPPAVLRWLIMSFVWLVMMGVLATWTSDNPDIAKDVSDLYGLNPALISTALAVWAGRTVKRWQEDMGRPDESS